MIEQSELLVLIKQAQNGSEEAKAKILSENSPLIKSVIRRFKNKGVEYEDLYQLGSIGFLKAIRNFSSDFNVKFSTYAVPMIAGEVKRFLRDDGYIKVSRSTKSLAAKIAYFSQIYKNEHQESPKVEEIAAQFGIEPQDVVFAMDSGKFPVSIYDKSDDEHSQSLLDKLAATDSTDDNLDKILLKDMINKLDEREKKIIILRYFRDKTQSEVARVLRVSQVQVSRLETKILEKLKSEFI